MSKTRFPFAFVLTCFILILLTFSGLAWILSKNGLLELGDAASKLKDLLVIFVPAAILIFIIAKLGSRDERGES